ncbi:hypothetical protein LTR66_004952 [Elasticomyces elasticus]|nr:hypothetical protein LTR66_004952 [Elasticomyces elasticus]
MGSSGSHLAKILSTLTTGRRQMSDKETNIIDTLTPREREIMAKAGYCFEVEPKVTLLTSRHIPLILRHDTDTLQVDYVKLAELCGMSNPRSASNAWGTIRKKMGWGTAAKDTTLAGTPKTPKTPASTKRKRAAAADDETPTKKSKGKKGKAKVAEDDDQEIVKEEVEDDD